LIFYIDYIIIYDVDSIQKYIRRVRQSGKLMNRSDKLLLLAGLIVISAIAAKVFIFSEQSTNQNLSLLYGYVSPSEEKYFKVSIDGQTKTEISIKNNEIDNIYDGFKTSKDGKYLAHNTTKNIEVASVDQLSMFNNIVTIPDENRVIGGLVWASDGTKLAYIVTNKSGYPPFVPPTLYIIDSNGSNVKTIDTHGAIYIGQLIAFNASTNEVYALAQVLLPASENDVLVSINLFDGSYKQLIDFDETGLRLDVPIISPDFTKAYNIINRNQLIEYNSNKTSRVIYVPKTSDSVPQDKIDLWALQISPRGHQLVFFQFNDVHPKEKEKQKERGNDLHLFDLQSEKSSILLDKNTYDNLESATFSPDGNYVLITTSASTTDYLLNVNTKRVSTIDKSAEVDNMRNMRFSIWLVK